MNRPALPLTGTCRCGELRIEVSQPALMTAACHCRGCQRMSASAFSLTAMIPASGFKVVTGDPVEGGAHGPQLHHYHCANCKSWMFTAIAGVKDFINVRPTMFEGAAWTTPFIETMTRDKLDWASTPAQHSFEEFPAMEELPGLIEEFAREA